MVVTLHKRTLANILAALDVEFPCTCWGLKSGSMFSKWHSSVYCTYAIQINTSCLESLQLPMCLERELAHIIVWEQTDHLILRLCLQLKQQHAAVGVDKAPESICVHFQMTGFCTSLLFSHWLSTYLPHDVSVCAGTFHYHDSSYHIRDFSMQGHRYNITPYHLTIIH